MIDIHCHPLPEQDDGAGTFEEALAMCRMAGEDGITHLVATPHCNYQFRFEPEECRRKIVQLQAAVGERPQLLLGCDFHLSIENLQRVTADHRQYTINGTSYLLVEFDEHFLPDPMENILYDLQVAGLTPIITHPERNSMFRRKPDLLLRWVLRGCLVQVTAQSYLGKFGTESLRSTEAWLENNLVHFFASDAHDTRRRPPLLSQCYQKLATERGEEIADLLMKKNPQAVIEGKPLPPGPPPVEPKPKRSWYAFLQRWIGSGRR
jgi:protein-tyrosine phosphatase